MAGRETFSPAEKNQFFYSITKFRFKIYTLLECIGREREHLMNTNRNNNNNNKIHSLLNVIARVLFLSSIETKKKHTIYPLYYVAVAQQRGTECKSN